ncbi:hypothetical protein [Flavivirga jejuensis]|uniref:Uncharacterized protein n=1 Tax=Flavivirga jejuensis TaxID=870487 RepID=A0ABT8WRB8_9FLAO|nr:hypothetical protein [Flavivirga jejuensis]MDO5975698.1 hypothetical protein [Flavivirga jejuensis]
MKTSETYKKEILEKYNRDKGGEMSGYLAEPTRKKIREACLWLLNRRKEKNDEYILNQFFQFKEGENKESHIKKLKGYKADKFVPVIQYLKGITRDTSSENLELISWLIDFQPRPLQVYRKSENLISEEKSNTRNGEESVDILSIEDLNKENEEVKSGKEDLNTKEKKRKWIITFSISIALTVILMVAKSGMFDESIVQTENKCMVWVKNQYEKVSCNLTLHKKYSTKIEPYDSKLIANFKKVEVTMKTDFFAEGTNKPLIWYTKNKDGKIEYFTSPGLHPITGKTLDEITPYIIQKYVPLHSGNINSFAD